MDFDVYETDYLAQSHWHGFLYRDRPRWTASTARASAVHVAPFVDDDGDLVSQRGRCRYDTLVIAVGSRTNDFGTPGARNIAIALDDPEQAERFHRRLVNACIRAHTQDDAVAARAAACRDHRRRRHRRRARGRAAQRDARTLVSYGLDRIDPDKDMSV